MTIAVDLPGDWSELGAHLIVARDSGRNPHSVYPHHRRNMLRLVALHWQLWISRNMRLGVIPMFASCTRNCSHHPTPSLLGRCTRVRCRCRESRVRRSCLSSDLGNSNSRHSQL